MRIGFAALPPASACSALLSTLHRRDLARHRAPSLVHSDGPYLAIAADHPKRDPQKVRSRRLRNHLRSKKHVDRAVVVRLHVVLALLREIDEVRLAGQNGLRRSRWIHNGRFADGRLT